PSTARSLRFVERSLLTSLLIVLSPPRRIQPRSTIVPLPVHVSSPTSGQSAPYESLVSHTDTPGWRPLPQVEAVVRGPPGVGAAGARVEGSAPPGRFVSSCHQRCHRKAPDALTQIGRP